MGEFARNTTGKLSFSMGWSISDDGICFFAFDEAGVRSIYNLIQRMAASREVSDGYRDRLISACEVFQDILTMFSLQRERKNN